MVTCWLWFGILTLGYINAQDVNSTFDGMLPDFSGNCNGCEPDMCFPVSGCAGCDVLAGWCANIDGDGCTRNCIEDTDSIGSRTAAAKISLHQLCRSNAVLARESSGPVFGFGTPGDAVTVHLYRYNKRTNVARTRVQGNGQWRMQLGRLDAGTGYKIKAFVPKRKQSVTANNVAVGELWLIAGQSNVDISLGDLQRKARPPFSQRAGEFLSTTSKFPQIRLFKVPKAASAKPRNTLRSGSWTGANRGSVAKFSAIGYLTFADVSSQLGMPVGVVQASYGGSSIVQWLPQEVLASIRRPATNRDPARKSHYNAMISPLRDAAWSGVLWYQGESNGGISGVNPLYNYYQPLLKALLASWRSAFRQSGLPWQVVQIPGYGSRYRGDSSTPKPKGAYWPYVREAERRVATSDKLCSLVSAVDLGSRGRVHPPNKFDLSYRLTASILSTVKKSGNYVASGPEVQKATRTTREVIVYFSSVYGGLTVAEKQLKVIRGVDRKARSTSLKCFEVKIGSKWVRAQARIRDNSSVILRWSGYRGRKPSFVRYAWSDFPQCNLYNTGYLPAVPFTTDNLYYKRPPTS